MDAPSHDSCIAKLLDRAAQSILTTHIERVPITSLCACLIAILLQGCTSAKIVEGAAKEAGKGNVLSALYMGSVGLAVGGIYDVVSLGGTLSPDAAGEVTKGMVNAATDRQIRRSAVPVSPSLASQRQRDASLPLPPSRPPVIGFADSAAPTASTNTSISSNLSGGSGCKTNLLHLAPMLPQYGVQELQETRSAILSEDINVALGKAQAMGYSAASAASSSLQSARSAEAEVEKARSCIDSFAADPGAVITRLERGQFDFSGSRLQDLGIHEACAASYVVLKYSAIASREMAVQMACLAGAR